MTSVSETPRAVARTAFAAYEAKRWREFASFVHDDALDEFRRHQLAMAEGWEQFPALARGDLASGDAIGSALEQELAQELAQATAQMGNPALRFFSNVDSVDTLRALEPADVLARFLEGSAPRPNSDDPEYLPPVARREIIGEVAERPDLVHVVYRIRTDVGRHGSTEEVMVVPVRRDDAGWRLMLNNELSFIGSMRSVGGSSLGE